VALIDLKYARIVLADGSDPPNAVTVQLGDGTLDYTEKRTIDVVKRRGELDTVREGDEDPVEVSFQFVWETLAASHEGDPPTIEDVLKRRGPAAGWASAGTDPEAPFCVNVAVVYTPRSGPGCDPFGTDPVNGKPFKTQTVWLEEFHYTELAHSLTDAAVDCKGVCNRVAATVITE